MNQLIQILKKLQYFEGFEEEEVSIYVVNKGLTVLAEDGSPELYGRNLC